MLSDLTTHATANLVVKMKECQTHTYHGPIGKPVADVPRACHRSLHELAESLVSWQQKIPFAFEIVLIECEN